MVLQDRRVYGTFLFYVLVRLMIHELIYPDV